MLHPIDADDPLICEAQRLSGLASSAEVVDAALREFVARRREPVNGLGGETVLDPALGPSTARGLCRGMDTTFEREEADR